MASTVTRFETFLPLTEQGTSDFTAIETFKTNVEGLCPVFTYPVYDKNGMVQWGFFGYITAAQQAAALGFLNTLNSALSTGPVLCIVWQGTKEP